jgi:hypothetical protein
MTNSIRISLAMIMAASLSACASMPGNLNGLGTDAGSMVFLHKNSDYGPMNTHDYDIAMKHSAECLTDVHRQQAHLAEVMITNGVTDAAAGAGGLVAGESGYAAQLGGHLAKGAIPGLAILGAATNGVQGLVNGVKIKSGAVTNIVGNCANGDLHDSRTAAKAPGMHVYGSSIRTNNSVNHRPAWVVAASLPVAVSRQHDETGAPDPQNP